MKLTTTIDVQLGRGQNMREHYAVRMKRVKAEREATHGALAGQNGTGVYAYQLALSRHADKGARITLHRPWARVPLDSDNLSGAFKGVRDEIADFLGVDDKSERLHWIYTQSKQPKGTLPTVTIEVMPVQDIDPQVKRVRELEARVAELEGKISDAAFSCPKCGRHDYGLWSPPILENIALKKRVGELEALLTSSK